MNLSLSAAPEQPGLFAPEPLSSWPKRLRAGAPERVYYEHFSKLIRRRHGQASFLDHVLRREDDARLPSLTQRDVLVACAVVQWLGTNCGMAFLHEAERAIEFEREARTAPRTVFPLSFHAPTAKRQHRRAIAIGGMAFDEGDR